MQNQAAFKSGIKLYVYPETMAAWFFWMLKIKLYIYAYNNKIGYKYRKIKNRQ